MTISQFLIGCGVTFVLLLLAAVVAEIHAGIKSPVCWDLIPTDQNPDVNGDMPNLPAQARYPRESALVSRLPDYQEM